MSRDAAVVQLAQYIAFRAVSGLCHAFPTPPNMATAAAVAELFAKLGPRRVQRAIDNLRACFPEWSDDRLREVAEGSIRHMFQIFLVDSVAMPRFVSDTNWLLHIDIGSIRAGLDVLLADRPAIFLTGHFGNWELLGFVLATIGFPLQAVARPLDNRWINNWLLGVRESRGMRILTKWGAVPELQRTLNHGGRVAFIADQNAGDDGLFVPFFGQLASSYKSIGLLAIRYRVPIILGSALRTPNKFRWMVECNDVIEPETWENQPDPLFYVTARYARALETMVRIAPEQYLWIHRRWKSRPRFEREGRPMPANLRRRLEELPWMTEAEMQRIVESSERSAAAFRGR